MRSNAAGRAARRRGTRASRAVDGRARANGGRRVFGSFTASRSSLVAVFIPSEREVSPLLDRRPGDRPRRRVSGALRVRHGLRRRRSSSYSCRCCCSLPLPYVPWLIAAAGAIGLIPDFIRAAGTRTAGSSRSPTRVPTSPPCWSSRPSLPARPSCRRRRPTSWRSSALVGTTSLGRSSATCSSTARRSWSSRAPSGVRRASSSCSRPVAFVATLAAYEEPLVLVAVIVPLVWLLDIFSQDRASATPPRSSSTAPTAAR